MQAETTWQRNAGSQIVLDSIFAGLAAIWVTIAINDPRMDNTWKFVDSVCALLSFFFFAISAEGTTNAFDERDVLKFVYYLLWYNLGVILVGAAIGILVLSHFDPYFLRWVGSIFWCVSPITLRWCVWLGYAVIWLVLLWRWVHDACWLLFKNARKFQEYLDELDDKLPRHDRRSRHRFMRIVFWHRLRDEKTST
jgi:hypothetical protein